MKSYAICFAYQCKHQQIENPLSILGDWFLTAFHYANGFGGELEENVSAGSADTVEGKPLLTQTNVHSQFKSLASGT